MPRPTVSGREASNKREQIVAASVRSFASRGVARTSMRRIARAVGITDATLYHYFPSKQALLEAAFRSATFQTDDLESALESRTGAQAFPQRAAREGASRVHGTHDSPPVAFESRVAIRSTR